MWSVCKSAKSTVKRGSVYSLVLHYSKCMLIIETIDVITENICLGKGQPAFSDGQKFCNFHLVMQHSQSHPSYMVNLSGCVYPAGTRNAFSGTVSSYLRSYFRSCVKENVHTNALHRFFSEDMVILHF